VNLLNSKIKEQKNYGCCGIIEIEIEYITLKFFNSFSLFFPFFLSLFLSFSFPVIVEL